MSSIRAAAGVLLAKGPRLRALHGAEALQQRRCARNLGAAASRRVGPCAPPRTAFKPMGTRSSQFSSRLPGVSQPTRGTQAHAQSTVCVWTGIGMTGLRLKRHVCEAEKTDVRRSAARDQKHSALALTERSAVGSTHPRAWRRGPAAPQAPGRLTAARLRTRVCERGVSGWVSLVCQWTQAKWRMAARLRTHSTVICPSQNAHGSVACFRFRCRSLKQSS
jgi:hypothetical protein